MRSQFCAKVGSTDCHLKPGGRRKSEHDQDRERDRDQSVLIGRHETRRDRQRHEARPRLREGGRRVSGATTQQRACDPAPVVLGECRQDETELQRRAGTMRGDRPRADLRGKAFDEPTHFFRDKSDTGSRAPPSRIIDWFMNSTRPNSSGCIKMKPRVVRSQPPVRPRRASSETLTQRRPVSDCINWELVSR